MYPTTSLQSPVGACLDQQRAPCLILDTSHHVTTSNKRLSQAPCLLPNHLVNVTQSPVLAVQQSTCLTNTSVDSVDAHLSVFTGLHVDSKLVIFCCFLLCSRTSAGPHSSWAQTMCVTVCQGYLPSQQFSCHTTVTAQTLNSCTHIHNRPVHH